MDQAIKDALLERLRGYLDGLDADAGGEPPVEATSEAADLFSVFVEIAAARNEMRTQSRLVKDLIDQFRGVFETLQSSHAVLERELKEARAGGREQARAAMRSLLLDIIDVRDRLAAGLAAVAPRGVRRGWRRWFGKAPAADPWREGMDMTLRRLDQVLADRGVTPIATVGRPFTPARARVVATIDDPAVADGVVVAEWRPGFEWENELLRPAEVTVARTTNPAARADRGDAL
ncbi:MAG: nucleotide exchange factor GrpE [Rhodoplanes sp.]